MNYGFIAHPENTGRERIWDYDKIEELIRLDYPVYKIIEALNMPKVSSSVIYKIIHSRNLPYIFGQSKRSKYYEEVLKLRREGMTYKEISEKLELPFGTVATIVRRERLQHSK